ncbi:TATA-box-binding protein [Folsomia candida]|uniref:TATA-box-binding protein n=1 Tax=Folsomia candida TaxID=158441 RepID=A0A226DK19_FOLCA|nr:TATA-box-binding protein [Folsomia candida]
MKQSSKRRQAQPYLIAAYRRGVHTVQLFPLFKFTTKFVDLKGKRKSARKPSLVATETARKLPLRAARRIGTGGDPPSLVATETARKLPLRAARRIGTGGDPPSLVATETARKLPLRAARRIGTGGDPPSLVATETARKLPLRAARRIGTGGEGDPPSFVPCNLPRQRPAFEVSQSNFEADGILGNGKGTVYPKYELDSQYNFIIPEPHKLKNAPWKQSPIEPPEGLEPTVLSVAASVNLGADLDLKAVADACSDLRYNPESFAPLVMRLKDPIATAMIFPGGNMIISGAKSVEACKIAVTKFTAMVRSVGFNVRPFGMLIKNISAAFSVGFKIRLRSLSKDRMLTPQMTYEPDAFTGVAMVLPCPKANVMVCRTGSGIIQGVTSFKDLDKVFKIIYPHLKMYAM